VVRHDRKILRQRAQDVVRSASLPLMVICDYDCRGAQRVVP
jgi:hypothetical protein